jgi:hypothetical protein
MPASKSAGAEAVLVLVGGILWLFYRDQLMEAWRQAEGARLPNASESASSTR